jgi:hypothetical protein
MQLWIWRHFRVRMPAEWEMLQFSRNAAAGRCAFADRYQFRLELNWRGVAGPPDFERMMSDYQARLLERGMKNVCRADHGPWRGVGGEGPEGRSTRFGRFFPGESCLVELVFLWPEERDVPLERGVLDSVAEEPADGRGSRRWRAFGMDLRASRGLALERCTVEPAHVEMVFADAAGRREERFARRGMVGNWLRGSVGDWLRRSVPREVTALAAETRAVDGHDVDSVRGEQRDRGWRGMLGRRSAYEGEAWICPADGRLYAATRTGGAEGDGGLSCCAALERSGGRA